MSLRSFGTIFVATLAYTVSTVYGLLQGIPLFSILKNGVCILLITAFCSWMTILIIENIADKDEEDNQSQKTNNNTISAGDTVSSADDNQDKDEKPGEDEDDFSPMTPPVLEVARQEMNGGEDNR